MQHTRFSQMDCPIARSLDRVGEWWSILILRDAFAGLKRFDEFEHSLGVAPSMLTRRLAALVESGLLAKRAYSARPPRYHRRSCAQLSLAGRSTLSTVAISRSLAPPPMLSSSIPSSSLRWASSR